VQKIPDQLNEGVGIRQPDQKCRINQMLPLLQFISVEAQLIYLLLQIEVSCDEIPSYRLCESLVHVPQISVRSHILLKTVKNVFLTNNIVFNYFRDRMLHLL
jgi:hypothetical protein